MFRFYQRHSPKKSRRDFQLSLNAILFGTVVAYTGYKVYNWDKQTVKSLSTTARALDNAKPALFDYPEQAYLSKLLQDPRNTSIRVVIAPKDANKAQAIEHTVSQSTPCALLNIHLNEGGGCSEGDLGTSLLDIICRQTSKMAYNWRAAFDLFRPQPKQFDISILQAHLKRISASLETLRSQDKPPVICIHDIDALLQDGGVEKDKEVLKTLLSWCHHIANERQLAEVVMSCSNPIQLKEKLSCVGVKKYEPVYFTEAADETVLNIVKDKFEEEEVSAISKLNLGGYAAPFDSFLSLSKYYPVEEAYNRVVVRNHEEVVDILLHQSHGLELWKFMGKQRKEPQIAVNSFDKKALEKLVEDGVLRISPDGNVQPSSRLYARTMEGLFQEESLQKEMWQRTKRGY